MIGRMRSGSSRGPWEEVANQVPSLAGYLDLAVAAAEEARALHVPLRPLDDGRLAEQLIGLAAQELDHVGLAVLTGPGLDVPRLVPAVLPHPEGAVTLILVPVDLVLLQVRKPV